MRTHDASLNYVIKSSKGKSDIGLLCVCVDVFIFFVSVTQYKVDFDTCLLNYNKIQKVEYTLR